MNRQFVSYEDPHLQCYFPSVSKPNILLCFLDLRQYSQEFKPNQTPALRPRELGCKPQPCHSLAVCSRGSLPNLSELKGLTPKGDAVRILEDKAWEAPGS